MSCGGILLMWRWHSPLGCGAPRRWHVVSNARFVELVVMRFNHWMHVIRAVTVKERVSSYVLRVLLALVSIHVRRVFVGLLVLPGIVFVVISVPNGVVSSLGRPLPVCGVFWELALRQLVFDRFTIVARRPFLLVQEEGSVRPERIPLLLASWQRNSERIANCAQNFVKSRIDS